MKYLLDTNAVIHAIRGRPTGVRARLDAEGPARVAVSAITVAELTYGAVKSDRPGRHELLRSVPRPVRRCYHSIPTQDIDTGC